MIGKFEIKSRIWVLVTVLAFFAAAFPGYLSAQTPTPSATPAATVTPTPSVTLMPTMTPAPMVTPTPFYPEIVLVKTVGDAPDEALFVAI